MSTLLVTFTQTTSAIPHQYPFTTPSQFIMTLREKPFENIVGIGEKAINSIVLLFKEKKNYLSHIMTCKCFLLGLVYSFSFGKYTGAVLFIRLSLGDESKRVSYGGK